MQKQRFLVFTAGLAALMMACTSTPSPSSGTGIYATPSPSAPVASGPQFVPGEVIVKFKSDAVAPARLTLTSANLEPIRQLGGGETLYTIGGQLSTTAARDSVLETVEALRARDDVEFAQPNYLYHPAATIPNDPAYKDQWHYRSIRLPEAWDVTTGSSSVVVAVLDTGKVRHPDLNAKFVGGYDFISDPVNGNDGNGRDNDASDLGGVPQSHGTHIAGTIAAITNNNSGVAGVCWNCKILPVRVLGTLGGSVADIVDAIRWAAGVSVPGVPKNANPAKVINLSLSAEGNCGIDPLFQDAINAAYAKGVNIVVSAGNNNKNAADYSPASCTNVITVAATNFISQGASYSNFGATVEISAPGGDLSRDINGDGYVDGILSTFKDLSGAYTYGFYQGTSMAAPHVSGVIGLMLSRNSQLTQPQILAKLQSTALGVGGFKCSPGNCGAGLVNAYGAVR